MEFETAKEKFVQTWGTLGSSWGINRTMAQIHALLLTSTSSLSTEDIMEALQISRGNTNMNVRELMDWGLVFKAIKAGERREFFYAEKDIWLVAKQIVKERRRREIDPVLKVLQDLKKTSIDKRNSEQQQFVKTISDIENVVDKMNSSVERLIKLDESAILGTLLKLLK
jgi:DNA-binding transcriptional regulator GbsR (MarR family)